MCESFLVSTAPTDGLEPSCSTASADTMQADWWPSSDPALKGLTSIKIYFACIFFKGHNQYVGGLNIMTGQSDTDRANSNSHAESATLHCRRMIIEAFRTTGASTVCSKCITRITTKLYLAGHSWRELIGTHGEISRTKDQWCRKCVFMSWQPYTALQHYDDVIMGAIASQITSITIVYSNVYSDADQRKHQSSASLAFVWGIHWDRRIPRTKGQLHRKCFHLMTSSCKDVLFQVSMTFDDSVTLLRTGYIIQNGCRNPAKSRALRVIKFVFPFTFQYHHSAKRTLSSVWWCGV